MYEKNIAVLRDAVENHRAIRNIKYHRKPDGSFDVEGNLKLWIRVMEPFEKIYLWEEGAPGYDAEKTPLQENPYMAFVPAPDCDAPRGTVIVAHGGGFLTRTGCEGVNTAAFFMEQGFNVAILTYRMIPYTRYDCLADMQRAIRILRMRKEELGISDQIAVMGFSAGGMLSGNASTHYDYGKAEDPDPVERFSCRPDACVIGYGAMTGVSFPQGFMMFPRKGGDLFGDGIEERFDLAIEKHVTPKTPPMFIWQTMSDDGRHGINLAKYCQDAGVPYELHIFTSGVHGLAMADGENDLAMDVPHVAHWGELCAEWLRDLGF